MIIRPCLTLAALAILAGCGASPSTERPAAQRDAAPVDQVASLSEPAGDAPETADPSPAVDSLDEAPAVPPAEGEPDAGRLTTPPVEPPPPAQDDPAVPAAEGDPAEAEEEPAPKAAELGRPDWWFDGVRRDEGRVTLCAEAGGETVREARRAAIAVARRQLDRALGREAERENVKLAMVLPLPAADAPGGAKYIGYVMMEARDR